MDFDEYEQTLVRLAAELECARSLHASAKSEFKRAQELQEDLGVGHPEERIWRAIALQDDAFYEYSEAILRYNTFLLHGKLPVEAQRPSAKARHELETHRQAHGC